MAGTLAPTTDPNVTPEEGDVNIYYNNELIGSLSEDGTAVLKTENTKVLHDIEVEYVKPETPAGISVPINYRINNTTSNTVRNCSCMQNRNGILTQYVKDIRANQSYEDKCTATAFFGVPTASNVAMTLNTESGTSFIISNVGPFGILTIYAVTWNGLDEASGDIIIDIVTKS
jgi:hypothetical protein